MKILHCSDVHLGRRPVGGVGEYSRKRYEDYFAAFDYIVDFALQNSIDVFIIAGDFFDKRDLSPEILLKAERSLERLKLGGIPVVITEGNHDNVMFGGEEDSWIVYLSEKGLLHRPNYKFEEDSYEFFPVEIGGIKFYGLGYSGSYTAETMHALADVLSEENRKSTIVLVHTGIAGGDKLAGTIDSEAVKVFANKAVYVAGGHLHSHRVYPQEKPYFFVPGSSEYFDLGEIGQKKGFIVFDTESETHTWHQGKCRAAAMMKIDSNADNFESFKIEFLNKIDEMILEPEMLLYCEIKLKNAFFIDSAWCEEQLSEKSVLKPQVKIIMPNSGISSDSSSALPLEEIEKGILLTWENFSIMPDLSASTLQQMKEYQKSRQEELFFDVFDNLLSEIIKSEMETGNEN